MENILWMTIENKLLLEKRSISVYHHGNRSVHLISHKCYLDIRLQSALEKDYLFITMICGPGNINKKNILDLPAWINYEIFSEGKFSAVHKNNRILLRIPAGLPEWKLKLTRPTSQAQPKVDQIIIYDED